MKQMRKDPRESEGLRDFMRWCGNHVNLKKATLVEIGTYLGESAAIFSRYVKQVITCDPWAMRFMQGYKSSKDDDVSWERLTSELTDNLKGCRNVSFRYIPGAVLARTIKDKSIDIVYIDAWHRVIPCALDIITWLPKVKSGGIISGHDYRTLDYSEVIPAVRYILGEPTITFQDSTWAYLLP